MADLELHAEPRTVLGKKVARLRREGMTPANIFGHNIPSVAIQVSTVDVSHVLKRAGATHLLRLDLAGERTPRTVLVRHVSRKATNDQLVHIDFYQVSMTEKTTVEVPLVLTGAAPAVANGLGLLNQSLATLTIECLPGDIPTQIDVDISSLSEAHSLIRIADLHLPAGAVALSEPDRVVAGIAGESVEQPAEAIAADQAASAEEEKAPAE